MIPDPLVYTGTATFLTAFAVLLGQSALLLSSVLLAISIGSFATRLSLDRRAVDA